MNVVSHVDLLNLKEQGRAREARRKKVDICQCGQEGAARGFEGLEGASPSADGCGETAPTSAVVFLPDQASPARAAQQTAAKDPYKSCQLAGEAVTLPGAQRRLAPAPVVPTLMGRARSCPGRVLMCLLRSFIDPACFQAHLPLSSANGNCPDGTRGGGHFNLFPMTSVALTLCPRLRASPLGVAASG